ncbi:MAG: hypothetical protein KKA28_19645, partial [Planctomycetes bacterium]|nr:hypothetical protein [Planctomycetota bacterium]
DQFSDWVYNEEEVLEYRRPRTGKIFKGIIGVETKLGGGKGAVSDYAGIAVEKGLDFIVFVDDIVKLTSEKFGTLKAECAKHSATNLQLFAGYKMAANTGNRLFVFGLNPPWPSEVLLIGPNKIFNLQYQDETGKFDPDKNPALNWCNMATHYSQKSTLGYYDFSHSTTELGQGLAMHDLRVYSVAALRTYEKGKLIDDALDDYLTTVQSTAVPTPVTMIIVRSPDELISALDAKLPLTYAQARSLPLVFKDALRWNCSYEGLNVFPSDGPIIHAWPKCMRTMTFGAEPFVTGRSLNIAPLHVTAEAGLKEIKIYDGRDLFRRFLFKGEKEFNTNLLLSGVVQRGLVLIAEDMNGGQAVSFAQRSYKEGAMCPIFCADHCNDCAWMLLAHGPFKHKLFRVPGVPDAGSTWDGGPGASKSILSGEFTRPTIWSDQGIQNGARDNQTPYLEFSDEGAVRCRSVYTETFPKNIRGNPWHAFGPLIPTTLFDSWAAYVEYDQYLIGVEPNAYGAPGVFEGPVASLFTEEIKYKKDMILQSMRLFNGGWRVKTLPYSVSLVFGKGSQIEDVLDASNLPDKPRLKELPMGSWFGLFSSCSANSQLFINRGSPLTVELNPVGRFGWLTLLANLKDQPVKAGETWHFEIFSISWPLNLKPESGQELVQVINYLDQPSGLKLIRGKRVQGSGGLFELMPDNHAIELEVPKPASQLNSVLPLRISPLNKRWTVGLYQIEGYRTHYYSKSDSGWRELGLDFEGRAYVPLYPAKSNNTRVMIGHPVVADDAGKDFFIQVTKVSDGDEKVAPMWHVSVNNPGDQPVKCTLRRAMDLPGLDFNEQQITLQPGEYKVLVESKPPVKEVLQSQAK